MYYVKSSGGKVWETTQLCTSSRPVVPYCVRAHPELDMGFLRNEIAPPAAEREYALPVRLDQVEVFDALCRSASIGFRAGGSVRIRDWRAGGRIRAGQIFVFSSRSDVERMLAFEQELDAGVTPAQLIAAPL